MPVICRDGGIGRRTRLKIVRSNPWEFDSPSRHQECIRKTYVENSTIKYFHCKSIFLKY